MEPIDLGDVRVGMAIATNIFDEFFIELHRNDVGLQMFPFDLGLLSIQLIVSEIRYLQLSDMETSLLRIVGSIGVGEETEVLLDIRLPMVLRSNDEDPPVLGFAYEGVHDLQVSGALETVFEAQRDQIIEAIGEMFNDTEGGIGRRIAEVELDLVDRMVEGLEELLFPDADSRPNRNTWASHLRQLPAQDNLHMDAVGIFVSAPGNSAEPGLEFSFLEAQTGFGLIFHRELLQDVMDQGAANRVGETTCGATLRSLNISVESDRLEIEGSVTKSLVDIPFGGPAHPFLYRGTTQMSIDASGVDADEPPGLSGFLKFLSVFTSVILPVIGGAILGLLGIIGGVVADVWAVPALWGAAEDLENADEIIQGGLAGSLGSALSALASGLTISEEVDMVSLESTPNTLRINEGHFILDALVFVAPKTEVIVNGWFHRSYGRFVFYELEGGQKFKSSELARLVHLEKITTPGFHDVKHANGRRFMRANRDDENANNLVQMFRENRPDEPVPEPEKENGEEEDDC